MLHQLQTIIIPFDDHDLSCEFESVTLVRSHILIPQGNV